MVDSKKHHYVPQFLLRHFAVRNATQIHVFDKSNGRSYRSNIANVAAENRLYEFEFDGMIATIEPSLAELESKASAVVRKILTEDSLGSLTNDDRFVLATFVALQILRTPNQRAMRHQMLEGMRTRIRQMGGDPDTMPELRSFDENEEKRFEATMMSKNADKFIPVVLAKDWVLHVAPRGRQIYISDNPVAMHNENDLGPYGNIGLAVEGVEVYLPLSATRCLAMYCPRVCDSLRRRLSLYSVWPKGRPLPPELESGRAMADEWSRAFGSGTPVIMNADSVTLVNSLQVWNAERFLYSQTDEFSLAREMIAANSNFRVGRRVTI